MFNGKTIVLGVTGGIAAYKAAALASSLVQLGARVETVLTASARQFIQPLTFAAITHAPVHGDPFAPWHENDSGHVTLAARADLIVIAPATASTIARLALGLADDLLALTALSTRAPMLIAPAMEEGMFLHPATQAHLATLISRGATVVGPEVGRLASGAVGAGRLAPLDDIVAAAAQLLHQGDLLAGMRVVVTAGGTREPLDPIRYIGNRSSGKMGYALASAAAAAGATVTIVTGPAELRAPRGVAVVPVETAAEMQRAVEEATIVADILIMAAAVSDFRPVHRARQKIKKEPGLDRLELRLQRTPDILANLDRPNLLKIGFAAETENLRENATRKLQEKGLAMIVANDAESTIGAPTSAATLLFADGTAVALPEMSKEALAVEIVRRIARMPRCSGHHAT